MKNWWRKNEILAKIYGKKIYINNVNTLNSVNIVNSEDGLDNGNNITCLSSPKNSTLHVELCMFHKLTVKMLEVMRIKYPDVCWD